MKLLIDADGCPVTDLAIRECVLRNIPCLLVCDTAHEFYRHGAETLVFDKGADSVDFAIANQVLPGDLVITQDYGLASICLARGANVLNQDGWEYTPENIDALLLVRHDARKRRAAGMRTRGPKKRTAQQDEAFLIGLQKLLQNILQG